MSIQNTISQPFPVRSRIRRRTFRNAFPYIVITPMLVWCLVFVIYPVAYSVWVSLHQWIASAPAQSPFVGIQNYIDLVTTDRRFPTAFRNTLVYTLVVTPIVLVIGFGIASLMVRVSRLTRYYMFAFFLPSLVPASIIGVVFGLFYQPTFGLANFLLTRVGFAPLNFMKDPDLALWTVATVEVWQRLGFAVLILYAGLLTLPHVYTEAARMDGANRLQILRFITLPLTRRVLIFVTVVTIIAALQAFDLIYIMTTSGGTGSSPGGPGISTYTLGLLVYNEGLIRGKYGPASATATILFVIVFGATILQLRFFRQTWEY